MAAHRFGEFQITVGVEADEVVVGVAGDLDQRTAPALGVLVGTLVDEGGEAIVLDLSALRSIYTSGLSIISDIAARFGRNRTLTLRATPELIRRILDGPGVGDHVRVEASDPNVALLGPEQVVGEHESSAIERGIPVVSAELAGAGARSSNEVIDAALRLVTALADATVSNADGVSVTLERHGRMMTVAASNDTVLRMDGHQYETGEGPCLAAAKEGRWFHSESLAEEKRWSSFSPLAFEQGINSILSSPLMAGDQPLGALNIYSNTERAFGTHEQEVAALFATQASGILTAAGPQLTEDQLHKRLAETLATRQTIAYAQGILMARGNITADDAAATLHRSARAAGVTVFQRAADIVRSAARSSEPEV